MITLHRNDMEQRKLKAVIIDGGPRKAHNTAQALQKAMEGARDAGAEVSYIRLFDLNLKGCYSCFACKVKNAKTHGICAIRDELRPILQQAVEADVVIIGSPVYFSYPTGATRSFIERFAFPNYSYVVNEAGRRATPLEHPKKTALLFTMNISEELLEKWKYTTLLGRNDVALKAGFGHCETLYICNTYQFDDYSRYDFNLYTEEEKRQYRDEHFPQDLECAYALGRRLVEEAAAEE